MNASGRSRTLVSGVLSLAFLSLSVLRAVDGVTTKLRYYYDGACEEDTGLSAMIFGSPSHENPEELVENNECNALPDGPASTMVVCDATTGDYGFNVYADATCTELEFDGVTAPSCNVVSDQCTEDVWCSVMTECTDDVVSTISPNELNWVSAEYSGAGCTDPTGNTVVISERGLEGGTYEGGCTQIAENRYSTSQCREDGSSITHIFGPGDDTCSGDVWMQSTSPTEYSPPWCFAVAAEGLYYAITSCTTDAASLFVEALSPAGSPAEIPPSPSPAIIVNDNSTSDSPSPTTNGDLDDVLVATRAPTSDIDGEVEDNTPAPAAPSDDDDDAGIDDTPAPVGGGSRGVSVTVAPTELTGSRDIAETPSPSGNDNEAGAANGGVGTSGGGVAAGVVAISCAVGVWVSFAV